MITKRKRGTALFLGACLSPALILMAAFMVYPALSIFIISLFRWGGYSKDKVFVGIENYRILFSDTRFWDACKNSLFLIVTVTAVTLTLSLFCAYILSGDTIKHKSFFRIVLYIPNILSTVVIAAVFSAIYDPSRGLLNSLLQKQILWLGDRRLVIISVAIAMIWQAVGYYMVMYMASMAQIPKSLYEAASLEGAGQIRSFFSITLPLIKPTLRTTLTFFIISNINLSFLLVRAMTGGGPDGASEVVLSYMYRQAYTNSTYGYGMAIGATVFIMSFALAAAVNLLTREGNK